MFDLDKIADVVKNVQGIAKNLPIDQIFTNGFMASNTKFKTIEDFLSKAGIDVSSLLGVTDSKDSKLNEFISKNTKFKDWGGMYSAAMALINKK